MAGRLRTIDLFVNLPIMDINRNALRRDRRSVSEASRRRMTAFWGDESWLDIGYIERPTLFGNESDRAGNDAVAAAYCRRLRSVAGFAEVSAPLPMCNRKRAVVYYLVFASHYGVATSIVEDIFARYRGYCLTQ
jgi:three-Cys-motif partner protein